MPIDTFRCELTRERLDAGERELAAALSLAATRTQEALRGRRERLEPRLRALGLVTCTLGAVLSGWAVVMTPVSACPAAPSSGAFHQVSTPIFVVLGVVFWFLPRISAELRARAPGVAARMAPRALAPLRRRLPSEVTYRLADGAIHSTLARPRRDGRTALGAIRFAVVGNQTACLFGPPPFGRLRRLVWLPGDEERRAVLAALEQANVPVITLGEPVPPAPAG